MEEEIDEVPQLGVSTCDCGRPDCVLIKFCVINPRIETHDDVTHFSVLFELENAQGLVDAIRELAKEKGFHVT